MRPLGPLALLTALVLTLGGCGSGERDTAGSEDAPSAAEPSETAAQSPEESPSEAAVAIPTAAICAGLDLDAVGDALRTPTTRIKSDLVRGDKVPLVGVDALAPQCTLTIAGGTAEFIVNELEPDRELFDAVRGQIVAVENSGFLDCGKVAQLTGATDLPATFHTCTGAPVGLVAAYNVVMADDWSLNCTVVRQQSPAQGRAAAEKSCGLVAEALAG